MPLVERRIVTGPRELLDIERELCDRHFPVRQDGLASITTRISPLPEAVGGECDLS